MVSADSIPEGIAVYQYGTLFDRFALDEQLNSSFNKQLSEQGLTVGKGTIIDTISKQPQATQKITVVLMVNPV